MSKLIITPHTKVAELLGEYPELEELMIEISPVFKKLRNPLLRRSIARLTTIEQAAAIANVRLDEVINKLRTAVGQVKLENFEAGQSYYTDAPEWFDKSKISERFDARTVIAQGLHPLGEVLGIAIKMSKGELLELTTPFLPAPLIEEVKKKGFDSYIKQEAPDLFKNYFCKK